jgi:hypothetical protein
VEEVAVLSPSAQPLEQGQEDERGHGVDDDGGDKRCACVVLGSVSRTTTTVEAQAVGVRAKKAAVQNPARPRTARRHVTQGSREGHNRHRAGRRDSQQLAHLTVGRPEGQPWGAETETQLNCWLPF